MDELAKKFNKNKESGSSKKKERAIGDDEPDDDGDIHEKDTNYAGDEEVKVNKKDKVSSDLYDLKKDEKGGISVGNYALGINKVDMSEIAQRNVPVKENAKEEIDEEDKEDLEFLMEKRKEKEKKEESDNEENEEDERISKPKKNTTKQDTTEKNVREMTIQNSEEFLSNDKAAYSSSVWVEIINQEGDKVFLNRITGEIAIDKPDEDSSKGDDLLKSLGSGSGKVSVGKSEEDPGNWRWLTDKEEAWIPAQFIKKKPNGKFEYQDTEGVTFSISEKKHKKGIPMMKKSLQNYVHDLLMLDEINEANILYNIKNRYNKKRIYTRLGKILISVNPYKLYPLYTPEVIEKYQNTRAVSQLPPHVYEIAKLALEELEKTKHPQSILIAGESGSGKTEACKQCMQFLAEVAGSESNIEKRLLDCSPILESMGNAQTVRNDNSSRFGKWSEIYFDENGKIVSGKITDYLLEKSRVSHQESGERSYHIFYQICRGLSRQDKDKYYLMEVEDYTYLTQSKKTKIKNVDDALVFNETTEAFDNLLSPKIKDQIFRILSAVLLIGNIKFKDNNDDSTSVDINSKDIVSKITKLLDVDNNSFEEFLLTKKSLVGTNEIVSNMNIVKAEEAKHGLSRLLYQRLFQEVVSMINESIVNTSASKSSTRRYIGILDIYGFEIFKNNSFEQF